LRFPVRQQKKVKRMVRITAEMVKELRGRTGAGIMDCRTALAGCGGDQAAAEEVIRRNRIANLPESSDENNHGAGVIHSYIHTGSQIGVLVEVECGTDFAARTEEFKAFAHDLAIHIAAMDPLWVSPEDAPWDGQDVGIDDSRYLLLQPFVKDASRTIGDLLAELSDRIGEPVAIRRFIRWKVGENIPGEPESQTADKPSGLMVAGAVVILLALAATFSLMLCL
jgi:elongation factor Ts